MATPVQTPPPLPPRKTSLLVWILAGFGVFVLLAGVVLVAGGLFLAKKVGDAASNPALATARLLAAANPDVEILSSDDAKGTVTFKDRKSGKVLTLNFDQIKQGKLEFEEDGKKVTIDSSGQGLNIVGNDGSKVQIGAQASAKLPSWLPAYPGATSQGTFAMQGATETGAALSFTTTDSVEKVSKFYEQAFKNAGLATTVNLFRQDGSVSGGMIAGEAADNKRSAVVNLASGDSGVTVGITYSDKQ